VIILPSGVRFLRALRHAYTDGPKPATYIRKRRENHIFSIRLNECYCQEVLVLTSNYSETNATPADINTQRRGIKNALIALVVLTMCLLIAN
jgi:hypothetical protein